MLTPPRSSAPRRRALIAEDSPTMATYIRSSIELLGFFHADIVTNGSDALNQILSKPYGLIILDHEMPGMKGLDIIRTLSQLRSRFSTPIILVTANVDNSMIDQIRQERLVVAAVVAKPFTQDAFQKRVAAALHVGRPQT